MNEQDEDEPIEVRQSTVHGRGAFATRPLGRGRQVGVYRGRRYGPDEAAERDWNNGLTYVFALSDGTIIDGSDGGNATRHLNHSCQPNCVAYEIDDADEGARVVIETRRRVQAGEELFIDYALDIGDDDPEEYPCRCGARKCRGTMAGESSA